MRLVISDTGPINYLVLIGHIDILPILFEKILLPFAVQAELKSRSAPIEVKTWMASPPVWLEVHAVPAHSFDDGSLGRLDEGEREAILLAAALETDTLLLIDEREGKKAALRKGLNITGTIAVLDLAAKRGLLDLAETFDRLRKRTFIVPRNSWKECLRNGSRGATHETYRPCPRIDKRSKSRSAKPALTAAGGDVAPCRTRRRADCLEARSPALIAMEFCRRSRCEAWEYREANSRWGLPSTLPRTAVRLPSTPLLPG